MKIFGMTLNNMTLLALSLATGIVIDDAIVVLENIFRYVEEKGVSPQQAAAQATDEIGTAVMATTLSLVVIFLPVVFITGQLGQYLLASVSPRRRNSVLDVRLFHANAGALLDVAAVRRCAGIPVRRTAAFMRRRPLYGQCCTGVFSTAS